MKTTERKVLVKEIHEELKSSGGIILDRGQTSKLRKEQCYLLEIL